jgi:hypothetical protein
MSVALSALLFVVSTSAHHTAAAVQFQGQNCRNYPETSLRVCGRFLAHWDEHGGLAVFGYPISDLRNEASDIDGRVYAVQYFERAVFEYHPENTQPYDVLLSLVGLVHFKQKYPVKPPHQMQSVDVNALDFPESGKRLGGTFLRHWQANGGLHTFGYPVTDEVDEVSDLNGKTYRMQYFERAVFELHPENAPPYEVLLSNLGALRLRAISRVSPGIDSLFKYDHKTKRNFFVTMAEQADTSNDIVDWNEKGWYVYNKLKEVADRTQPPVAAYLHELRIAGNVEVFQSFYIVNGFSVTGNLAAARSIATLPGVGIVSYHGQ